MLFNYEIIDDAKEKKKGSIDAINIDVAISSLQKRGFVISSIKPEGEGSFLARRISFFEKVSTRDLVIFSRQISTLFSAQVPALRSFLLVGAESENLLLKKTTIQVSDDLQGGSSISNALAKHPAVFSSFYVNMVRAGEESGKLNEVFLYLADYVERSYRLNSKAKNALVYPAFVLVVFVGVMGLMMTTVIPKISAILLETNQELPVFTKIVIGISNFLVDYGLFFLVFMVVGGFFLFRFLATEAGDALFSQFKINIPYVGGLYKKLFLARIAGNMNVMLLSGIAMVRAIEITSEVVDDATYKSILQKSVDSVKAGSPLSDSLTGYNEIPRILVQMMKIGEETGNLGEVLKNLSVFYEREVEDAVDALVGLIEPLLIVLLAAGVGLLLVAVIVPMYNISAGI